MMNDHLIDFYADIMKLAGKEAEFESYINSMNELTKGMEKRLQEEKKHTNEAENLNKSSMGHIKEAKETFLLFEKCSIFLLSL